MTSPQPPVPPPPQGYDSWISHVLTNAIDCEAIGNDAYGHARAELAALRKALATTQGLLATARENLVALEAKRAEAVRERDTARASLEKATTRQCYIDRWQAEKERDEARAKFLEAGKLLHETQLAKREISDERDALRAQVEEMREAVLGLGWINTATGHERVSYGAIEMPKPYKAIEAFNALVARLCAEATQQEGQQ